jgi:hypothetical protein
MVAGRNGAAASCPRVRTSTESTLTQCGLLRHSADFSAAKHDAACLIVKELEVPADDPIHEVVNALHEEGAGASVADRDYF